MYKLNKFDESDIKECFAECGFSKCNFKERDGGPLELNSMDDEGNHISVVSINSDLTVELSNGKTCQLADVINDEDDVEILIAYITEYYE